MKQTPSDAPRPKRKIRKRILVAVLIFTGLLLVLLTTASLYAYYRGSKVVQAWIISKVHEQTKGLYTLTVKDVDLVLIPGRLRIEGLSLVPDTARYRELQRTDTLSSVLLTLHISKIILTDFDVLQAIRDKEVTLDRLVVEAPDIQIDEYDLPAGQKKPEQKRAVKLNLDLPSGLNLIEVKKVRLNKGRVLFRDHRKDTLRETLIPEVMFEVDHIFVSRDNPSENLFNAQDIRISLKGFSKKSKNGMFTVVLGEIGASTAARELFVKDLQVNPEYTQVEFGRKLGYQTDWMKLSAKEIRLSGIDLRELILNENLKASRLTLAGVELEDYRDKRNPPRKNWKPPMPHEALAKLKVGLRIDSVFVTESKLTYTEQSGSRPGSVYFERVNLSAGPLNNDSAMMAAGFTMNVKANALLMGSGALNLAVSFPFPVRNGAFSFSGLLTGFDMRKLNPFVSAQVPVTIVSGYVDRLVLPPVFADSDHARGSLTLLYHDLKANLPPQNDKTWETIKKSVLTFAANTYVASSNPGANGNVREGVIYFERDPGKSIFNYLWKSVFSGIKSTVNVNSKEQKEIKKEEKRKGKSKR